MLRVTGPWVNSRRTVISLINLETPACYDQMVLNGPLLRCYNCGVQIMLT